jgi:hypothetical protein
MQQRQELTQQCHRAADIECKVMYKGLDNSILYGNE